MKRNFVKLFVVFGILLCIFALFGCEFIEFEPETSEESRESISQTKETLPDDEEPSDEEESSEIETDETTGELTDSSFAPDEELIAELEHYLYMINAEFDMPEELSFSDKINIIKSGTQALFLNFAPDDCYYVCGYYRNDKHDYSENDTYCCSERYTWIGFNDEKKIVEQIGDESFVVAFQLNRAENSFDLLPSDKLVPNVEHITLYTPNFENGVNIAESLVYDGIYIYLNSSNKNTVYYYYDAVSVDYHKLKTIPCIELEDQYFIIQRIYPTDDSGTGFRLGSDLGEYYDSLMGIMIPGKYSQEDYLGRIQYYGLFEIEEFVNTIFH